MKTSAAQMAKLCPKLGSKNVLTLSAVEKDVPKCTSFLNTHQMKRDAKCYTMEMGRFAPKYEFGFEL